MQYFQIFWRNYEIMSSRHRTANLHADTSSEHENDNEIKQSENHTDSPQVEKFVEVITNPTENTQQNPLQVLHSC